MTSLGVQLARALEPHRDPHRRRAAAAALELLMTAGAGRFAAAGARASRRAASARVRFASQCSTWGRHRGDDEAPTGAAASPSSGSSASSSSTRSSTASLRSVLSLEQLDEGGERRIVLPTGGERALRSPARCETRGPLARCANVRERLSCTLVSGTPWQAGNSNLRRRTALRQLQLVGIAVSSWAEGLRPSGPYAIRRPSLSESLLAACCKEVLTTPKAFEKHFHWNRCSRTAHAAAHAHNKDTRPSPAPS